MKSKLKYLMNIYSITFIGCFSYLLIMLLFSIKYTFLFFYLRLFDNIYNFDILSIFLLSWSLSIFLILTFKIKKYHFWIPFNIFCYFILFINLHANYKWKHFLSNVKTENVYKTCNKKDSFQIKTYENIALLLSEKYSSDYKIQFTRELPYTIYGLTYPPTKTIYYNANIFLHFKDTTFKTLKNVYYENEDCIIHEISHVVHIKKYPNGGHDKTWCKIAKSMGVKTERYEKINNQNKLIKFFNE